MSDKINESIDLGEETVFVTPSGDDESNNTSLSTFDEPKAESTKFPTYYEQVKIPIPDNIFAAASIIVSDSKDDLPSSEDQVDGQCRFTDLPIYIPKEELLDDEPEEYYNVEKPVCKYDPDKPRHIDGRFDFAELFIFTLVAVMIITSFFFRHSIVDGESMENTLYNGEHLIISDLFYTPEYGDIIVCEDYTTALRKPIVKRIIATEGQTVEITLDGRILVDGTDITDEYSYIDDPGFKYTPMKPITVPEGEVFVMGDHRNNSTDSRLIGTISEESILGKVILRFYPFNKFGTVN